MNKRLRPIVIVALLGVAIVASLLVFRRQAPYPKPGPVSDKLVVRFLDVGQGDSELIQLFAGRSEGGRPLVDEFPRGSSEPRVGAETGRRFVEGTQEPVTCTAALRGRPFSRGGVIQRVVVQ